ncbi:MAG: pyridoxal kinase PdxY [Methylobacteriaceae bacterium]|jgi:pyridoxine kinase|nr:pyridoxal kinase PdxY [Methylobacteriaceae bacterium]
MNILSIQSHVVYGHVGNAAATFCIQRLGVEVWPILTVQFSNHTGYSDWTGPVFDGAMVSALLDGVEARGVLPQCSGVLSGYVGGDDIGAAIIDAVTRVRKANPSAIYCCDPVMGDYGRGLYVSDGIPGFMKHQAMGFADILTPNQFELELLTDSKATSRRDVFRAVSELQSRGPRVVAVTSVTTGETPADAIEVLVGENGGFWLVRTPRFDTIPVSGTGDVIASLFFVHYLRTRSAVAALEAATSSTYSILKRSVEAASPELLLIDAQEEIVRPTWTFTAEKVG